MNLEQYLIVRDTYILPTGFAVSGMIIQATTLTGTYVIKSPSVLPEGLNIASATGEITGTPTRVAGKTTVAVELTLFDSSKLETTIDITVTQGNNYIDGYTDISGKVGENLTAVIPNISSNILGEFFDGKRRLQFSTGLNFATETGSISGIPTKAGYGVLNLITTTLDTATSDNYNVPRITGSLTIAKGEVPFTYETIVGTYNSPLRALTR